MRLLRLKSAEAAGPAGRQIHNPKQPPKPRLSIPRRPLRSLISISSITQPLNILLSPRHSIIREPTQPILALSTHTRTLNIRPESLAINARDRLSCRRATEGIVASAEVACGLFAGADVDCACVGGVEVGGSWWGVGEREVGLTFGY